MVSGRCLCSGVRFEITGELGPVIQCHCSMCRRASGTAFATNVPVHADAFRIVQGQELITEYESSPGRRRAFCSRCGSPLYSRMLGRPEIRRVRLGTLEEDPGARPVAHTWVTARRRPGTRSAMTGWSGSTRRRRRLTTPHPARAADASPPRLPVDRSSQPWAVVLSAGGCLPLGSRHRAPAHRHCIARLRTATVRTATG
ncbi:GFA family protein [Sorangium sp. So ce1128]